MGGEQFRLSAVPYTTALWASEKLIKAKFRIQAVNERGDSAEYYKIHPAEWSCQRKKAGAVLL